MAAAGIGCRANAQKATGLDGLIKKSLNSIHSRRAGPKVQQPDILKIHPTLHCTALRDRATGGGTGARGN